MQSRSTLNLKWFALFGIAAVFVGVAASGCSKSNDDAPTNTKDSQYMGGGNTAADKIGEERRKARLPNGGKP
ncbi:hypothetical protein BH11ARM2_BH11ARM2_27270 [soil metagenome]